MKIRRYSELIQLNSFEERFEYLKIENGIVGADTFGSDRYLNQMLYRSGKWKKLRNDIIIRDNACDLGVDGYDLKTRVIIHHMNPITKEDILNESEFVFDPEYLICTCHRTHNAIHYGNESQVTYTIVERKPNDTIPWK